LRLAVLNGAKVMPGNTVLDKECFALKPLH
jgi:hypothetical protein